MTKDSQDTGMGIAGFDPTAMMRAFMPNLNEASTSGSNPFTRWLELNQHWTAFLTKRYQKDKALLQQLATCSSPTEMNAAYSDFFKKAVEDYQRELTEIAELGQKAMGQQEVPGGAKAGQKPKG